MEARLYVIPASHPSICAALMLDHKGIAYKRTDLLPVISKGALRALGFPRKTVPGDQDRRTARAGLARDRPRARAAAPGAGAVPLRSGQARRGRGGRALRRRGAPAPDPPAPLVVDQEGQGAAAQLLGGRQARRPDRPGDDDRRPDRRPLGPLQRGRRRERPPRPRRIARPSQPGRRLDRAPAC